MSAPAIAAAYLVDVHSRSKGKDMKRLSGPMISAQPSQKIRFRCMWIEDEELTFAPEELLEAARNNSRWHHSPHAAWRLVSRARRGLRCSRSVRLLSNAEHCCQPQLPVTESRGDIHTMATQTIIVMSLKSGDSRFPESQCG